MHWWGPLERGSTWVQVQMHHHQRHSGWWSCQRGIDVESCWSQYIWFEKRRTWLVADCLTFLQLFWLVNGGQFATCSYKDLQLVAFVTCCLILPYSALFCLALPGASQNKFPRKILMTRERAAQLHQLYEMTRTWAQFATWTRVAARLRQQRDAKSLRVVMLREMSNGRPTKVKEPSVNIPGGMRLKTRLHQYFVRELVLTCTRQGEAE